jgi:hypothetical protein
VVFDDIINLIKEAVGICNWNGTEIQVLNNLGDAPC